MNTSIWDKFEYKAVVCFTGYTDRYALLQQEFNRVGLEGVNSHWDFPNPYNQILLNTVPMTRFNKNRSCFYIGLNNYRAVATAYHLGCNSCLIMEDDIRFLKDLDRLEETVRNLPDDFDLAMFDNNKPCSLSEQEYIGIFSQKAAPNWSRFTNLRSTGCYAMSRRGMEAWLRCFEAPAIRAGVLRNPDGYFRVEYLGADKNLYVANPPAAIQFEFGTMHSSSLEPYYALHAKIGANRDKYAGF